MIDRRRLRNHRHTRGGYWNVRRDRDPKKVVASICSWFVRDDLDWVLLQETSDYLKAFRLHLDREFWVIGYDLLPGQANTCIIVDKEKHPECPDFMRIVQMTQEGWFTSRGGKVPPKFMPICRVYGWLLLGSLHYAPSVHQKDRDPQLEGPVRRVLNTREHAKREVLFFDRRPDNSEVFLAGDRNNSATTKGWYTPRWIADKADADLWFPQDPTHHSRTIDGGIGRNIIVLSHVQETDGSDHHKVMVDVYEEEA
jgi:hypothetical protein